ncbi:tRNA pseudouridine(55) synthase TruB [Mycoplasma sp. 1018B]|uniref:tRNA pseudouridine(55) synthase TruB n=1 Tax=Mycoplasma sp. 1018B TaxID=2967302 RepID=UPI00211BFF78|nr:tRNA pseudouridine(55) synthase TruB [Mycoplasma sp. 1018B]UUM19047.1 tRNA pseudouridine(55) synthase TruB [Mycoplasma sp. 1018B]
MFYLLYKKENITSFAAIKEFAKQNNIKKIGHSGTLDPFAKGLLLVATDEDTKLLDYLKSKTKIYVAKIKFGTQTDTYDLTGKIINTSDKTIYQNDLLNIKEWFLKQKIQKPPIYSAKKINGKKAYEYARENKTISLKNQNIEIKDIEIINFNIFEQTLTIKIKVSNGTYIRSLANDLGLYLNTYSHLLELERIEISELNISLLKNKLFAKINDSLKFNLDFLDLSNNEIKELKKGKSIHIKRVNNNSYLLRDKLDTTIILGIIQINNNECKVVKLFGNRLLKY